MHAELLILRIIHVVGGVIWAGTAIFVAYFLMPAIGMAGPAGPPVMGALVKRRLFVIVPTIAVITILAGLRLLWRISDGFSADYFATPSGTTYATGMLAAIAGFTIFLTVSRPALGTITRLRGQMEQLPASEHAPLMTEMNAARGRAGTAATAIATLLIVAAVTMAIARYV